LASLLAPQARVVLESDRRAPLQLPWEIEKERRYGDTSITIHRYP
jgi:16S rRNA G966 N2-methylase RsmD